MSINSSIEWTQTTWNPVTGCTKISAGCLNCYAERMAKRLKAMGQANYKHGFKVSCHKRMLSVPATWKKPQIVFVNSMGDLFHDDVPDDFIVQVFDVMANLPQHRFQVLTKRAKRLRKMASKLQWTDNIWMGVTVESNTEISRIEHLRNTEAKIRFLSMEPLLSDVPLLNLDGIDWVIVGGESGPGARKMESEWVRSIHKQCQKQKVPFFFKQWGGFQKKKAGRTLDGKTWDEMPKGVKL